MPGNAVGKGKETTGDSSVSLGPETGEKRQLASLGQGAFIMFGEGSVQDVVYDGHYALFLTYLGSGRANICRADLSSGETEVLFEDADNVTFRIIGDTKDALSGKYII